MFFTPLLSGNKGCACIIRACNYSFSGAVLQEQLCNEKPQNWKHMLTLASCSITVRKKVTFMQRKLLLNVTLEVINTP